MGCLSFYGTGATALPYPGPATPARSYRALYILNWIYRFITEPNYRQYLGACARAWPYLS
jgi:hypothetical protein